ncbi:hypothetical protein NUW58_g5516 [Xylaria curta]|uniref:Uncharacterized protein n=1 Tax=Xylaria curta TaxID=42375 RepID=A0ACC1P2U1_9PEZI|nr:hypothetical protein NUW58_g5516 [Xylaria curta]
MSRVRPPAVDERVRPQPTLSVSTSRTSASVPLAAYEARNPNTIAQGSVQNSPQQPTLSTTRDPHIKPDLWGDAKATLSDDEQKYINRAADNASMSVPRIVEKMVLLAMEKRQQCANSKWKTFRLSGHEISLSDLANNAIEWLNKFKGIGDIIVQYDPVHATLPWAAARLLLQATIVTKEQMAACLIVVEKVTRIIHRCQVYEATYNRETVGHAVVGNLESALVKLYASVLRGVVQTDEFLSKPTLAKSLYSVSHPTSSASLLASLENGENEVEKEIAACAALRKASVDKDFDVKLCGLLELKEPILRTDENVKKVLQQLDEEELTRILQWISHIEYRTHHNTVKELRTKDTCDWLLGRPELGQWGGATSTMTLWLQGFPGSGKTFLTSRAIEKIEALIIRRKSAEGFAFFYCNRNEGDRRNALVILRSYVRQLSTTPHRPDFIYSQLKQLYTSCEREGSGWTLGLCQEYLIRLFELYPSTVLVLDALDECEPEEREILLDFFDSIPSKTSKPVKIFISSRPEGDIRQRLTHLPSIEIQATDNENDIAKLVKQSIERNGRWSDTLRKNELLKDEIVHTLLDQSKGMFQWAALQINQLLNLRTEPEIKNRLGKLPKGLKAAYDEIFANIENLTEPAKTLSHRTLQWIMCAYEPLSSKALLPAIRVDPEKGLLESFEPTEADLLDWCANLIRIDSQQNPPVWRVSHLSVVEYLETRWALLEAHCFVAKASLVLLHETYGQHEQGSKSGDIFDPRHPLQVYVGSEWIRHTQTQERRDVSVDPKLAYLLKTFLGSLGTSSVQYRNWHRQFFDDNRWLHSTYGKTFIDHEETSPSTSPIFLACRCSFYTLIRDWWDSIPVGLLLQLADEMTICPLALAAAADCTPLCIKLCEAGIPVNKPDKYHGSALAVAASWKGSIEIVQLLLDKGADINMLPWCETYGSPEIVQLLIDNGAIIPDQGLIEYDLIVPDQGPRSISEWSEDGTTDTWSTISV